MGTMGRRAACRYPAPGRADHQPAYRARGRSMYEIAFWIVWLGFWGALAAVARYEWEKRRTR